MADNINEKIEKLLAYGNQQLEAQGVSGDKDTIREVLDGISDIQGGGGGPTEDQSVEIVEKTITSYSNSKVEYVGASAFLSNSTITEINLPNCVIVNESAFNYCSNLINISLPKCKYIYRAAFYSTCMISQKKLNFSLPECLYMEGTAFYGNSYFDIYLPNCKITSNKMNTGQFISTLSLPKCVVFGGCLGSLANISLPNCLRVTTSAFANLPSASNIYIPNLITAYGSAFMTTSISNIEIPFLEKIQSGLFQNCQHLKNLRLPNIDNTAIGNSCFSGCFNLSELHLGGADFWVTSNISSVFYNCSALESLYLEFGKVTAIANSSIFNNTPMISSTRLGYYGSIYVPEDLLDSYKTSTYWSYFSDRFVGIPESIMFSDKVREYKYQNSTITEIPQEETNKKYIGGFAFNNCKNITSASFPNCEYVGIYGLGSMSTLSDLSLPKCKIFNTSACSQTAISIASFPECLFVGSRAFATCTSLISISLPKCLMIRDYAFQGCTNVRDIYLPNCVSIGNDMLLAGGRYISSLDFPNCLEIGRISGLRTLTYLNIPLVYSLPQDFCISNTALETVNMGNVQYIGASAFQYCSKLKSVNAPYCSNLQYQAFCSCTELSIVNLPRVSYLANAVFAYCSNLKNVNLPCYNGMTAGSNLFDYCRNLESVYMPVCTVLQSNIFRGCYNLSDVYLPFCRFISDAAFLFCSNLSILSLPNCAYISRSAFSSCIKLSKVILGVNQVAELFNTTAFTNTPITNSTYLGYYGSIYVPASLVSLYKTAPNWSLISDRITAIT